MPETNQLVVTTSIQTSKLTGCCTYHEVVTNSSAEMKEIHNKGAGDVTASYSNVKTNYDCWSKSLASFSQIIAYRGAYFDEISFLRKDEKLYILCFLITRPQNGGRGGGTNWRWWALF